MSIKSILSVYSGEAAKQSGLRHATKLANYHDAWLTGVLAHGRSNIERSLGGRLPKEVVETIHENENERIRAAEQRFNDHVAAHGRSDKAEFLDLDANASLGLNELARCYDLIVTGVHSNLPNEAHMSAEPDMIALQSGRPVLVVPNEYEADALANHAIVAWDGKRSAARALGDAMSILEEKAKVTILTIGNREPDTPPGGGIMKLMERHGINASHVHRETAGRSIAKTVEITASELSAKLIVMGAFEHSKFSQNIFGGVTTEILATADIPVFMSH